MRIICLSLVFYHELKNLNIEKFKLNKKKNGVLKFLFLKTGFLKLIYRKKDTDDLLAKCFEFDWNTSKI